MKKNARSLLITALILFCAGLLLTLCASLYAILNDINMFDVNSKEEDIQTKTVSIDDILAKSPEASYVKKLSKTYFTQIDIKSFAGNIKICTNADKTELLLSEVDCNNFSYFIEGGTLKIEETDPVGIFGIYIGKDGLSFKGLRHIFASNNKLNTDKLIVLKLAKNTNIKEVNIDAYLGSILCENINTENLNIKNSIGKVKISGLSNEKGKIKINGDFTTVNLKESAYSSCAINSKIGNISANLEEQIGQSTIIDLWCGNVNMKTKLPTSYYKLSLSSSLGKIEKNNKNFGKKLAEAGSTASRISSGILLGDFTISYDGKSENDYIPPKTSTSKVSATIPNTTIETNPQTKESSNIE